MDKIKGRILERINNLGFKELKPEELLEVCDELRNFIIDVVSTNPGHFGASLGVVELTVALHYVFNSPHDHLFGM